MKNKTVSKVFELVAGILSIGFPLGIFMYMRNSDYTVYFERISTEINILYGMLVVMVVYGLWLIFSGTKYFITGEK